MARLFSFVVVLACGVSLVLASVSSALADSPLSVWKDRQEKVKQVIERVRPSVVAIGGGSGVIVSADGYVLTVSHVNGAPGRQLTVNLPDGRTAIGTTLGSDLNSDAAVVKLDGDGPWPFVGVPWLRERQPATQLMRPGISLVAAKLSEAADVSAATPRLDDWCLAFGYPLSFPRNKPAVVRLGQIKKVSKRQVVASAVIMGGDSGGPLVSMDGQLIAISSRVKTTIGSNIFVPIECYEQHWSELTAGTVMESRQDPDQADVDDGPRAWLGVFGDTDRQRVRIRAVQKYSPADEAGLSAEDVILKINDQPVQSFSDIVDRLRASEPGDSWRINLNRYGKLVDVTLPLGVRP